MVNYNNDLKPEIWIVGQIEGFGETPIVTSDFLISIPELVNYLFKVTYIPLSLVNATALIENEVRNVQ